MAYLYVGGRVEDRLKVGLPQQTKVSQRAHFLHHSSLFTRPTSALAPSPESQQNPDWVHKRRASPESSTIPRSDHPPTFKASLTVNSLQL